MSLPVSLRAVVDELSFQSQEHRTYLHKPTGDIVVVSLATLSLVEEGKVEPGDEAAEAPEGVDALDELSHAIRIVETDEYEPFPSSFEIHEWAIMRDFCHSVEDSDLQTRLLDAIHGRRAFRRFKDAVHNHRLAEEWYAFRDVALKEIAERWLGDNQIPYIDDTAPPGNRRR